MDGMGWDGGAKRVFNWGSVRTGRKARKRVKGGFHQNRGRKNKYDDDDRVCLFGIHTSIPVL